MAIPDVTIPIDWDLNLVSVIHHNGSRIGFRADGEILLDGSLKDTAIALIKYVVDQEYVVGLNSIEINKCVKINVKENFALSYVGKKAPPTFWDAFVIEYNRIIRMRAFW